MNPQPLYDNETPAVYLIEPSKPVKTRWTDHFNDTEFPTKDLYLLKNLRVQPTYTMLASSIMSNLPSSRLSKIITAMKVSSSTLVDRLSFIDNMSYFFVHRSEMPQVLFLNSVTLEEQQSVGSASTKVDADLDAQAVLKLDKEARYMCIRKGLFSYVRPIYEMILGIYQKVIDVKIERIEDPEIIGYEKLCFDIHLKSQRNRMLEDKVKFYNSFFKKIPEDKQQYFVFTYMVS